MKKAWIEQLESQGCFCSDWSNVTISENTNLQNIRNVYFSGHVSIGDDAVILNVPGGLKDVRVGARVRIINVAAVECSHSAKFGVGTDVNVLDETGKRIVRIYPGISAQIAALSARIPDFSAEKLLALVDSHIENLPDMVEIGDDVEILNCGVISDVRLWNGVKVDGALRLVNGSIVNNSRDGKPLTFVGAGVDAENFIIEDGVVKGGCIIRNTYVGQGAVLDKGFTSHDSLFFANCSMENGEACAVFAGPYSVSMHKSSLLIGCQTSFFNTGSGTNMSNHMYKLGPAHWGVLERGVKTASNAYIMHGSHIGSFSLVMGDHKSHPNTSEFPFSYLFGSPKGRTTLVPGAMLKSYGLKRDEEKWPDRDRRLGHGLTLHDRITFPVLNPFTIGEMLTSIDVSCKLIALSQSEEIEYNDIKLSKRHLLAGIELYKMAICKYISENECTMTDAISVYDSNADWCDLAGQILPELVIRRILMAESISSIELLLDEAVVNYDEWQQSWMHMRLGDYMKNPDYVKSYTDKLLNLVEEDRIAAVGQLIRESMHSDIKQ